MQSIYLFPHKLKRIGWVLLIPGLILGILNLYFHIEIPLNMPPHADIDFLGIHIHRKPSLFEFTDGNFTNELAGLLLMCGLMFIAFSRRKLEDEFIAYIRLNALLWAVYANSVALVLCIVLIYGGDFFSVLIYNMYTIPVIFLLRFQYLLHKASGTNNTASE